MKIVEIDITKIAIQGGSVISYVGSAGAIIGSIKPTNPEYHGKHRYNLEKIYSSATVSGTSASGLIGTFDSPNNSSYMTILTMTNIQNMGTIDLNPLINNNYAPAQNTHSSFIGNITNYSTISFSTYISNPLFRGFTYSNSGLYGHKSDNSIILINSGYNLRDGNTSAKDIRDIEAYNGSWDIGNVWVHRTFENIPRIAILKNATFNYTSLSNNITLEKNTSIKISDMVNDPNLARIEVTSISDNSVVSVTPLRDATSNQIYDLQVNAIGAGTATIHVISQYDGYEKDIVVTSTVAMESFELSETEIEIDKGSEYTVIPIYTPSDTTEDRTITWTNTDASVASINGNNVITGLNPGTTIFTGVLTNGKQVQLTVTVNEQIHLTSFVVSNSSISLNPNDSWELAVQYNPSPTDSDFAFKRFVDLMGGKKNA